MGLQANELRIGNWINKNGELFQIELPDFNLIANRNSKNKYEPIPLTEERLLDFGYVHNKKWNIFHLSKYTIDNVSHQKKSRVVFRLINDKIQCLQYYLDSMSTPQWQPRLIFIHEIGYAHQLQNLIFALADEELTLTKGSDPL